MEKYSLDQALSEAEKMNTMLKNGTAKNYSDANSKVDTLNEQRKIWDRKWSKRKETAPATNFAKEVLSELKGEKMDLLDLGAGDGRDSILFAKNGHEVTAIDLSSEGINCLDEAGKKLGLKIHSIVGDIATMELGENRFDVIYSNLGLHFFDKQTTKVIFDKLYSSLKSNGQLFISAKAKSDKFYGQGQKISEDVYKFDGQIRHFFSEEYTNELLAAFDQRNISTKYEPQTLEEGGTYDAAFIRAKATKSGVLKRDKGVRS
jgi:2-polyprenyl-3-methyl-5-hydroxy-6-metoxy-1,4-benzoquinol methylase